MNVIEYVLSLAATLDPDLLLDVESKFGRDWQDQVGGCKCKKAKSASDKYTVKELRKLAREHKIKGRSKLRKEQQLIDALTAAGVL